MMPHPLHAFRWQRTKIHNIAETPDHVDLLGVRYGKQCFVVAVDIRNDENFHQRFEVTYRVQNLIATSIDT